MLGILAQRYNKNQCCTLHLGRLHLKIILNPLHRLASDVKAQCPVGLKLRIVKVLIRSGLMGKIGMLLVVIVHIHGEGFVVLDVEGGLEVKDLAFAVVGIGYLAFYHTAATGFDVFPVNFLGL